MLSSHLSLLFTTWLVFLGSTRAADPGETGFTFCNRPNLTGGCKYTSRYDEKFGKVWEAGVPNGSFSLVANPGVQCFLSENAAIPGAQKIAHYR